MRIEEWEKGGRDRVRADKRKCEERGGRDRRREERLSERRGESRMRKKKSERRGEIVRVEVRGVRQ